MWSSLSFLEFRKAKIAFKNEKYDNPKFYDEYIEDYEEDSDYRKIGTEWIISIRMNGIGIPWNLNI